MDQPFEKYRKKPIVIEAYQYNESYPTGIETLEGIMRVNPGDWIIKGVKGELYPCKDDIFKKTYDKVDDTHADDLEKMRMATEEMVKRAEFIVDMSDRMKDKA